MQFARQGGIDPDRFRAACQNSESPEATKANINIGVLGMPVRQYLLVQIQDEALIQSIQPENAIPVDVELLSQHLCAVARLADRANKTRERIISGLIGVLPSNIDSLV